MRDFRRNRNPEHSIREATDDFMFWVTKVTFLNSIFFIRDSLLNIVAFAMNRLNIFKVLRISFKMVDFVPFPY